MDRQELQEFLRQAHCFADLDDEALHLLQDRMEVRRYADGETVFSEGDTGDWFYVVRSGEGRVLTRGPDGREIELARLQPGELGGVTSLFLREPRSATLRAEGDLELWTLDHDTFHELLRESHDLSHALLTHMSRHLREERRIFASLQAVGEDQGLRVAFYDTKPYWEETFERHNSAGCRLSFLGHRLSAGTAGSAQGHRVVCAFVNDDMGAPVVERLRDAGVELVALRSAGYNNVDLDACRDAGISVARVPEYSPHSVAEHGIALMMALNRKISRAHSRVREGNFSLDGLVGFEVHGKSVGIVGTGRIGRCAIDILLGFGCCVLAYDKYPDEELRKRPGVQYVDMDTLLANSDVISLYVPLTPETHHLIDATAIGKMKRGVMLINTSRGGIVDTQALIDGLKSGHVGSAGLDVYEEEGEYFFEDFSDTVITDDALARLLSFNNVMVTSHMAFLTREALNSIAETTFDNIREFEEGRRGTELTNGVCPVCE